MNTEQHVALIDLLDNALDKGVVAWGDLTISLADVDLVYAGVKLLLASVDTANRLRPNGPLPNSSPLVGEMNSDLPQLLRPASAVSPLQPSDSLSPQAASLSQTTFAVETQTPPPETPIAPRINIDPDRVEQGLAQLVLTIVELLRQLMERQAMHRIDNETLTEDEVERVGLTLMRLEEQMDKLKAHFGIEEDDLNLDLGPLGKLL